MSLRAIYFDLDDTLCGYWDASKTGMRRAFELHPVAGKSTEEMIAAWATAFRTFSASVKDSGWYEIYCRSGGPTRTEQMRLTLMEAGQPSDEHAKLLSDAYGAERDRNLKLFPDALEVLNTLSASYPLGLITNGPADIQRQEIATLDIGAYFSNVFIEGEMGIGKPHAVVFERAAAAVGARSNELLFIGNSYAHDIAPAIENGWHTAWIRRDSDVAPSRNFPEGKPEDAPEPTITIGALSELLPFVASL